MVEQSVSYSKKNDKDIAKLLILVFDYDRSVGGWIKMSLLSR